MVERRQLRLRRQPHLQLMLDLQLQPALPMAGQVRSMSEPGPTPPLESLTWSMACTEPLSDYSVPGQDAGPITADASQAQEAWDKLREKNPTLAQAIVDGSTGDIATLTPAFLQGDFGKVFEAVWSRLYSNQSPQWKSLPAGSQIVPKTSKGSPVKIDPSKRTARATVVWDTKGVEPNPADGGCKLGLEFTWARHKFWRLIDQTLSGAWPLKYMKPERLMNAVEDAVRTGDRETALHALQIVAKLDPHADDDEPFILRDAGDATNRIRTEIARQMEKPRFRGDAEYASALQTASVNIEIDSDKDGAADYNDACPRDKLCK